MEISPQNNIDKKPRTLDAVEKDIANELIKLSDIRKRIGVFVVKDGKLETPAVPTEAGKVINIYSGLRKLEQASQEKLDILKAEKVGLVPESTEAKEARLTAKFENKTANEPAGVEMAEDTVMLGDEEPNKAKSRESWSERKAA